MLAVGVSSSVLIPGEKATSKYPYAYAYGGPLTSNEKMMYAAFSTEEARETSERAYIVGGGAVLGYGEPLSNVIPARNGLRRYKVRGGDTLSSIAAQFGISLDTLRYANPDVRGSLRVGQELLVLPVSGALYETKSGDSLEALALRFDIEENELRRYNPEYQKMLSGIEGLLVLPHVKPKNYLTTLASKTTGLPDLRNYFILPASGWNWGELHETNAVDIANQCGTVVHAAQEGLVVPDDELGDGKAGWNNGYGIFVLIEHPNGTKTRYAHLARTSVRVGDYVSQSDEVGLMGNTGNTHGPTGCHLHFEVYGAKNPFAVK